MAKTISIANITAGFKQVAEVSAQIDKAYDAMINTSRIHFAADNPYAMHDSEEDIQTLADDIALNGLLHPIVLNKVSDDEYVLISGERRFKAITQILNWKTIRSRVFENLTEDQAQLMLHSANLKTREYSSAQKLHFYEDCLKRLERMKEDGKLKGSLQTAIGNILNVTNRQVRTYKTIVENTTPEERAAIIEGSVSLNTAYKKAAERKSGITSSLEASGEETVSVPLDSKWIEEAIRNRSFMCQQLIEFYSLSIPTTSESVQFLKTEYRHSGATVTYSNRRSGFLDFGSSTIDLEFPESQSVSYTYSELDSIIRKMIREQKLLPLSEHKKILSSFFTKKQLAEVDRKGSESM